MKLKNTVRPLLDWYERHARRLPWREDTDPYRVWVSEIMLQQTRVEAVIPYFERFMKALPDVAALAGADEEQLLKLWEGLGYYSRVRNLHKAAEAVMEQHDGKLPDNEKDLLKLPGIGAYTAGAIASISFGLPVPAVDGNVLRVLSRIAAIREEITKPAVGKAVREALRKVYPEGRAGDFTQALMELGATVCLPNGAPLCDRCPLAFCCEGFQTGTMLEYPVKPAKKPRKIEPLTVFILIHGKSLAVRKREGKGVLSGMWELPNCGGHLSEQEAAEQLRQWGIIPQDIGVLKPQKHIFTHIEWRMRYYMVQAESVGAGQFTWISGEELVERYTLPNAFKAYRQVILSALDTGDTV